MGNCDCSNEVETFALDDGSFGCWFMVHGENFGSEQRSSSTRGDIDIVEELLVLGDHIAGDKPMGGNAVRCAGDSACCCLTPTALFWDLDLLDDDIAYLSDAIESLMSSLEDRSAFTGMNDREVIQQFLGYLMLKEKKSAQYDRHFSRRYL